MRAVTSFLTNRYTQFLILALFARLILIPNPGFEADISFWKSWGLAAYDKGAVEAMNVTNNNYPTPFIYTLGLMIRLYALVADPHAFGEFWKNTNILFLAVSKLFPILADFGIAALITYVGRHAKRLNFPDIRYPVFGLSFYEFLSLLYLLNPVSLIDGALWGQVDSVGVCIFLAAVVTALNKRPFWAGFLFMLAMMTKLQNMIYGPVLFLFLWQTAGLTGFMQAVAGAAIGFLGLNAQFLATHNADRILANLTENYDYFPWMSLMAYNLWWIVSGGRGMMMSDKMTVLGLINAKTAGLLLFSGFYLFAMLRQFLIHAQREAHNLPSTVISFARQRLWSDNQSGLTDAHKLRADQRAIWLFLESLVIVNAAFFLFQTQSHDRYAFPLSAFLLLWLPLFITDGKSAVSTLRFWVFAGMYAIFSVFYFYNLHTALVVNYPHNGLPWLSAMTQPVFTITTSFILIGLFAVFIGTLLLRSRITQVIAAGTLMLLGSAVLTLNLPLLLRQSVSLTAFTPFISEQAYGTRQTDKAVQSSFGGPHQWTRLSVQYLFYAKGIGTHANSRQVFHINGKFTKFTTDYGIDTEAGPKASARFELYGDGRLLFRSESINRFTLPRHADVNIAGIRYLSLVTTDDGDGNYDDHTDWLNPTLWP